jgi:hypothetical protein
MIIDAGDAKSSEAWLYSALAARLGRSNYGTLNRMKEPEDTCDDSSEVSSEDRVERSHIADEIDDLRSTILRLANDRERLPQPLFWSLFNSRLKDIKRTKELSRLLKDAFNGTDEV